LEVPRAVEGSGGEDERPAIETLPKETDPRGVGKRDFYRRSALADEDEQGAAPRVVAEALVHEAGEPLEAIAKVDGVEREEDRNASGDHRAPPSARTTSASSAGSKPGATRTRASPTSRTSSSAGTLGVGLVGTSCTTRGASAGVVRFTQ